MSFSKKIARATQNNYRLNRRVLKMVHSWNEVQFILDTACRKKKGCCPSSSYCDKPEQPCSKPSHHSCSKPSHHPCPKPDSCHEKKEQNCRVNPRSPFYPFF